jgi:hypothetical protein
VGSRGVGTLQSGRPVSMAIMSTTELTRIYSEDIGTYSSS